MGITTVLWVIVALLTKPDPDKLLNNFYKRVHPLGFWKPFRAKHEVAPPGNIIKPIFWGLGVAIIGFAATCLLIQGLTGAWFGYYQTSIIELIISILLFIVFKKTSKKYLDYLAIRTAGNTEANTVAKPFLSVTE